MIDVEKLTIINVSQEYWDKTSIDINFKLETGCYQLHVKQDEKGVFQTFNIYHMKQMGECFYCDGSGGGCRGLGKHMNELFLRLIEHPSIRLEWLYLPHAAQA